MDRTEVQNKALELSKTNKNILLEWCTGLGKTKAAIDILLYKQGLQKEPLQILLVVAEQAHLENWRAEFKKWDTDSKLSFAIICYASLKKATNTKWDIVILDESHHAGTALKLEIFKTIKIEQNFIMLSATISNKVVKELEDIFGFIKKHKVTLKQAINAKILPKPHILIVPLNLDSIRESETIEVSKYSNRNKKVKPLIIKTSYANRWNVFHQHNKPKEPLKIVCSCTQVEKYRNIEDTIQYFREKLASSRGAYGYDLKLQRVGLGRKTFLGNCKTEYINNLVKELGDTMRYICFCTNIAQARLIENPNKIHSKIKNTQKIISNFNEGVIDSLITVNMLKEGQNLNNIELGIITQMDANLKDFIQKLGRILRAKNPIQVIFYFKNTKDEIYLNNALASLDKEYINIVEKEDLIETIKNIKNNESI